MDVLVYVLILSIGHMDTLKTSERFTLRDENMQLNIQSCLFNYVLILSGDGLH